MSALPLPTAEAMPRAAAWRALGASVRGAAHVQDGLPNQDALLLDAAAARRGRAGIAVADGHGGARHFRSATGSRLAVSAAREAMQAMLPAFEAADSTARAEMASIALPRRIVQRWAELARAELAARPITQDEWRRLQEADGPDGVARVHNNPLLAYGSTLLFALALPGAMVLGQIGDGDLVTVDADGSVRRPVPPDDRLAGQFTTSLSRPGAEHDFRCVVREGAQARPALVLLATDGYANSFRESGDVLEMSQAFVAWLQRHGTGSAEARLPAMLEHATHHGSGDDITVALLVGDVASVPVSQRAGQLLAAYGRDARWTSRRTLRAMVWGAVLLLAGVVVWMRL